MEIQSQDCENHIKKQFLNNQEESVILCRTFVNEIINNIENHYEYVAQVRMKTEENQYGKKDNIINSLFSQLLQKETLTEDPLLKHPLHRIIEHLEVPIYHLQVHKQFVPNMCGYHATYNLVTTIHSLKHQQNLQSLDCAGFWSFVNRTQQFLHEYSKKTQKNTNSWPWRTKDIEAGDFERTYWNTCLNHKQLFKETFASPHEVGSVKLHIMVCTLYFQYGNLSDTIGDRKQLEKSIKEFVDFKTNEKNLAIFGAMLGVTNHWVSIVATKSISGIKIYFMDSRDRDYLTWTHQEMSEFLERENAERQMKGLKAWLPFHIDVNLQSMKDIQQVVHLMAEWLSGQSTVEEFAHNSYAEVFLKSIRNVTNLNDPLQFLKFKMIDHNNYQALQRWADEYCHTIFRFCNSFDKGISDLNKAQINQVRIICQQLLQYNNDNNIQIKTKPNRVDQINQSITNYLKRQK